MGLFMLNNIKMRVEKVRKKFVYLESILRNRTFAPDFTTEVCQKQFVSCITTGPERSKVREEITALRQAGPG